MIAVAFPTTWVGALALAEVAVAKVVDQIVYGAELALLLGFIAQLVVTLAVAATFAGPMMLLEWLLRVLQQ